MNINYLKNLVLEDTEAVQETSLGAPSCSVCGDGGDTSCIVAKLKDTILYKMVLIPTLIKGIHNSHRKVNVWAGILGNAIIRSLFIEGNLTEFNGQHFEQ
ncbi:hypothetical protein NQ315_011255 [Exocentrus adspersus]|uniref:Uncharacterized protein n=1 Tax=Exocentrus adspersus TaxID=1586481 RepID=A0AAV8V5E3_9CUCU|nr:hypothetical protein NQ315_011255 [Exocentrus adspersus]